MEENVTILCWDRLGKVVGKTSSNPIGLSKQGLLLLRKG